MMQRHVGSHPNSSHKAPSLLSICRVIALRRGPLSIETMAICRSCRVRRISMTWLPREDSVSVHRSQVHYLGGTPIAVDLRYRQTGPSEHGKEQAMKAIRCRAWGTPDSLRLEEAESPKLQPHQVRIRVRAAGANFADTLMVGGRYQ